MNTTVTNTNTPAVPKTYATALLEASRLAHELAQQAEHLVEAKEIIADLCGPSLTPTALAEIWSERRGGNYSAQYINAMLTEYGFQKRTVTFPQFNDHAIVHFTPTQVTKENGYGKDVSGPRYKKRMHWRVEVLDAIEAIEEKLGY